MENVEPITDKEIEQIKLDVRAKYEKRKKTVYTTILISTIVLGIVFISSSIILLKWHFMTLIFSIIFINLLIIKITGKYAD